MSEPVAPDRPTTGKDAAGVAQPLPAAPATADTVAAEPESVQAQVEQAEEIGGPRGLEPTRFGDWERKGRCIDF